MKLTLWSMLLDLALIAYSHPEDKADKRVRKIANRYLNLVEKERKQVRHTLRLIIKSKCPSAGVKETIALVEERGVTS